MSQKEYNDKNVDQIIADSNFPFPKNVAMAVTWILGNAKGVNLKILNVTEKSSLSDFFVLASVRSTVQAKSAAQEISRQMKRHKQKILSTEGLDHSDWILLDLGDVLVHIFLETSRNIYDLDSLWKEAPQEEIPQSYYFSSDEVTTRDESEDPSERNYF